MNHNGLWLFLHTASWQQIDSIFCCQLLLATNGNKLRNLQTKLLPVVSKRNSICQHPQTPPNTPKHPQITTTNPKSIQTHHNPHKRPSKLPKCMGNRFSTQRGSDALEAGFGRVIGDKGVFCNFKPHAPNCTRSNTQKNRRRLYACGLELLKDLFSRNLLFSASGVAD